MMTLYYLEVWSHSQNFVGEKMPIGNSVAMSEAPLNPRENLHDLSEPNAKFACGNLSLSYEIPTEKSGFRP